MRMVLTGAEENRIVRTKMVWSMREAVVGWFDGIYSGEHESGLREEGRVRVREEGGGIEHGEMAGGGVAFTSSACVPAK